MEMAVVGQEDFVIGFSLAGVRKTYAVGPDKAEFEAKVEDVFNEGTVGILVVNDEDLQKVSPALRLRMTESIEPVVISIGKVEEVDLRDKIKRAVGVDLWG